MKKQYRLLRTFLIVIVAFHSQYALTAESKAAEELKVPITKALSYVDVQHGDKTVRIQRNQNTQHRLSNSYTKTSRVCPPFCIQPQQIAAGVKTVSELELLEFIQSKLNEDEGLLIDGRLPNWNVKATIPGAISLPFTIISNNLETTIAKRILLVFGADKDGGAVWDFSDAQELLFFGNGAWGNQSSRAIKNLLELGYPPEKISWYRGGLQSWLQLGFTVVTPEE